MSRRISIGCLHIVALLASAYSLIGDCAEHLPQPLLLVGEAAVTATVEELRTDWGIMVSMDGERTELSRSDYVLWGAYSDEDRASQVLLTDGTVLVGEIVRIEDQSVTLASRLWGELQLDRQMVLAWCLLPQTDPFARDRERQLLQTAEPHDRVLLLNRDAIAGKLLPTTERDGGGLFGLVSVGIALSDAAPATPVLIDEIRAITFRAAPARESHSECLLGFRDGSLVPASKLSLANIEVTQITTAAGASLQLPTDELLKNLTFIQPQNESVTYLSDLPAVGYKFLPFLELDWPLGIATNTLGGRLRSGGDVNFKGIGMHSTSRVAYTLDRQYRRFEAELALDDHSKGQGSVIYRVLVERDNELEQSAWSLAFTSPIIRGGDPPLSTSLDVTDATRLALVVEMADRADTRDYANWLNARLLR